MNRLVRRDEKRRRLSFVYELDRIILKQKTYDSLLSPQERLKSQLYLSQLPRDSSKVRVRNRCVVTGRGRGVERHFRLSRLMIRQLASNGLLAGMSKSSW